MYSPIIIFDFHLPSHLLESFYDIFEFTSKLKQQEKQEK